jgi:ribulose kinase
MHRKHNAWQLSEDVCDTFDLREFDGTDWVSARMHNEVRQSFVTAASKVIVQAHKETYVYVRMMKRFRRSWM